MMKYRFNVAMFIYMCLVPVACIMLQAISSALVYSICNDSSTHLTPYISFLAYALYIALFGYGYYKLVKPVIYLTTDISISFYYSKENLSWFPFVFLPL